MSVQFGSKTPDAQPKIQADVLVGNQWKQFTAILDSGNDITLISEATAAQLGISRRMARSSFKVQFGNTANDTHNFFQVSLPMKFGNMKPFQATIGVGKVRENLIGRKDAFEHHDILFSGGKIKLFQSNPNSNTFGVDLGGNRQAHAKMNSGSRYRDTMPNNYI